MSGGDPRPDVLDRILHWAEGEELVRAVVLTSTRAMPGAHVDPFSDYDVVLYVADTAPFARDLRWLECVGPVLVSWPDEGVDEGFPFHMRLVIYRGGAKVDFTVAPVERLGRMVETGRLPDALDVGYRVLLDRDGLTAALPPPTGRAHIPERPTQEEFLALVEEFWFETTYVAKNLWRDELLPARHSLETVMKLDLLRRMLEWRVETDHGWALRPGVMGKGLEKHLDAATWAELEATFAGADVRAGWRALFATTRLFSRVAQEVAARLGLAYPHDLDREMTSYLRSVEASDPKLGRPGAPARPERDGACIRSTGRMGDPVLDFEGVEMAGENDELVRMMRVLLETHRSAFAAREYEISFHALSAAAHAAESLGDTDELERIARLSREQLGWIDAHDPDHRLASGASGIRGHTSIFEQLAITATGMRQRIEADRRLEKSAEVRHRGSDLAAGQDPGW